MVNPSGLIVSNCGKMRAWSPNLLWIEIGGDTQQPMLRPRLPRVPLGVELVDGDKRRSAGDCRALDGFLRHRGNRDILDLHIALLNLASNHL